MYVEEAFAARHFSIIFISLRVEEALILDFLVHAKILPLWKAFFDLNLPHSTLGKKDMDRQRGQMGKGFVFTTTLIECSGFNRYPGHVVVSLDKTLYDIIISAWWLRTGSKFSGQEFKDIHRNIGSSETPKQVQIPPITK